MHSAPQSGEISSHRVATAHYLATGRHDAHFDRWDGDLFERARRGTAELKAALVAEIRHRAPRMTTPAELRDLDPATFARRKLTPMVSGLFPEKEREPVLRMFERSLVFVTPENVERVIAEATWLSTAWEIANLYLGSIGAEPLGGPEHAIVGLSEETTCYVSMAYFTGQERFADFIVHEAAHVFHNCKRRPIGLPETRRREWLLEVEFRKRETFAYACEAYSRILELAKGTNERLALVRELAGERCPLMIESTMPNTWTSFGERQRRAMDGSGFWRDAHRPEEGSHLPDCECEFWIGCSASSRRSIVRIRSQVRALSALGAPFENLGRLATNWNGGTSVKTGLFPSTARFEVAIVSNSRFSSGRAVLYVR